MIVSPLTVHLRRYEQVTVQPECLIFQQRDGIIRVTAMVHFNDTDCRAPAKIGAGIIGETNGF